MGATLGVGLLECGGKDKKKDKKKVGGCQCLGINCKVLLKTFAGWVVTLIVVGTLSALLTAQAVFAPAKTAINSNYTVNVYRNDSLVLGAFTYVRKGTPL